MLKVLATTTMEYCANEAMQVLGGAGYLRGSKVERIYRDLSIYIRHDNDDQILATIGKAVLGKAHDTSFYKP